MIDLSKLGGGTTSSTPPSGGFTSPATSQAQVPLPSLPPMGGTTAPSSPDGDQHNMIWDQFGRALFGSQNTQVGNSATGGGLMGDQPLHQGQHGGLLGDIPILGDIARVPGTLVRGLADAGGVGLGAGKDAIAEGLANLPSFTHLTDNAGLGDPNNLGKSPVNAFSAKYSADPHDPVSVGAAGWKLAQDINAAHGQSDMATQFLLLGQWQMQYDKGGYAEWQKTLDQANQKGGAKAAEALSHYIREWSTAYADMTPEGVQGWYETHPELAFAGEGSLGQGFTDDLARMFSFQTHAEKGAAQMSGSHDAQLDPMTTRHLMYGDVDHGSRLNELLWMADEQPKNLTAVEAQAVAGVKSLGWSDSHAYDFLISHGQGFSANAGTQTLVGMALDPTFVAGLGATAPAMIAEKAAAYGGVRAGITGARTAMSEGRLADAAAAMTRVIGSSVAEVRSNPILGPVSKVARTMVDPLSSFPGAKADAMKDVYSTSGTAAWEKGFGAPAVSDAARRASNWGVRDVFDRSAGSSAMNWARKFSIARHIDNLKDFGAVGARRQITEDLIKTLGENSPKDAVSRMADYVYQRREYWLSHAGQEELVKRIITTTGKTEQEVRDGVAGMSRDEQAVWHDLSYREAWRDFEGAKAMVPEGDWGALTKRLDDLVILNPSELDNIAAQGIHGQISKLMGTVDEATGKTVKGKPAKAIEAWNEAASKYPLIENLGRVKPGGVAELGRRMEALKRIIDDGGLHTALDISETKALPKQFLDEFGGKWTDQWRFGFKPNAHQASGLVFDKAGELMGRYEPSIGNVVEGIAKPARGFMPVTDAIGRVIPGRVANVADSLEVAYKVARDSVSSQRVMTSMEQSFVKQMRAAGYSGKVAKSVFRVNRDYVVGHTMTLAGMRPAEFWEASAPMLKDIVDADVAKRDIFNMLITSAGGDMRLLGITSGMTQRIRSGLLARSLNPDNYLGVVTSRTYNLLRYALNPTFFLQAEFDAPWFNMYRGVMFDLKGAAPKPGTGLFEMQSVAAALSKTSLSRDLAMDYTERVATIGFQTNVLDALKAVPGLESSLADRIKMRLGRMVMNNELLYMNSKIGENVVNAVTTTRNTLLKKAEEAGNAEEAAVWRDQAQHLDIEHVFDYTREQLTNELGRVPTTDEVGRRYLSEMIDDSQMEVRTKQGLLDYSEHMKKAGYFDPGVTGQLKPLDLAYGASALRLPNIHSVADLADAMKRGVYTNGDIADRMTALGFHKANIQRFTNAVNFNWRTYFDDLRRQLGMSRFEMQGIEDLVHNEAKAQGLSSLDYLTQVLPITAKTTKAGVKQAASLGLSDHMKTVLGVMRAAKKGEAGMEDMAKVVSANLHPSMKERLLNHFMDRISGTNGLIEQAMAKGDPKLAQDLNLVLEDLKGGWGDAAVKEFKDLVVRRAGGETAGDAAKATWAAVPGNPAAEMVPLDALDQFKEIDRAAVGVNGPKAAAAAVATPAVLDVAHLIGAIKTLASTDQSVATKLANAAKIGTLPDMATWLGQHYGVADKAGALALLKSEPAILDRMAGVQVNGSVRRAFDMTPPVTAPANAAKVAGDTAYLDALAADIKANGIKEPLTLEYDPHTGSALLTDGNHRLAAARRAGLTDVPVELKAAKRLPSESDLAKAPAGFKPTEVKPGAAVKPSDLFKAVGDVADPEVERAARYFSQYLQSINPQLAGGEVMKGIVDNIPVAGASAHDFTQAALMDTLAENFRLTEKDAIRLAHMSTERTVLDRSLNHPFFAMYPTSYFWGKVIPETFRFMAYEPFGIRTGAGAEAYYKTKTSIDLQSQYDPRMKDLWGKVGKSAVLGLASYLSPSMPWEDMRANLPPWVRALSKDGTDFGGALTKEFDTFDPLRWVSHFTDAAGEVGDGASTVVDSLTGKQQAQLKDVSQQFAGMAPQPTDNGIKGTVKGTALGPILSTELQDLQAALRR